MSIMKLTTLSQSVTQIALKYPAVGTSPAGFPRIHAELLPKEVGRLVGYDPRTLVQKVKRKTAKGVTNPKDSSPHNVSSLVVALQNQVQRSIDNTRVQSMVGYLKSAMDTDAFADWGSIEVVTDSRPDFSRMESDHIVSMDADTDYFIADGQHRYCALLDFVRTYPEYADRFTQSLTISVLPEERLVQWAGQAFHDRNYYAVAVRAGKALAVDSRNVLNAFAKELAGHPAVTEAGGIAYERDTLLKGDLRFTSHSVLHRFTRGFLLGRPGLDRGAGDDLRVVTPQEKANLTDWLSGLSAALPWNTEDRDDHLSRTSSVLSALSVIGHDVYATNPTTEQVQAVIGLLGAIDWRRTNLSWVGVIGSEKDGVVQPASSRPAIDATIRFLREKVGLQVVAKAA